MRKFLLGHRSSNSKGYNTFFIAGELHDTTKEGYVALVDEGAAQEKGVKSVDGPGVLLPRVTHYDHGLLCGIRMPKFFLTAFKPFILLQEIFYLSDMTHRWRRLSLDKDVEYEVVLADFTWLVEQIRDCEKLAVIRGRALQLFSEISRNWDDPEDEKVMPPPCKDNLYAIALMFRISCSTSEITLTDKRFKEVDTRIRDCLLYSSSVAPISKVASQIITMLGKELMRCTSSSLAFLTLGLLMPRLLEPWMAWLGEEHAEDNLVDENALEHATTVLFKAVQAWQQRNLKSSVEPDVRSYQEVQRALQIVGNLAEAQHLTIPRSFKIWFDRPTVMAIWDIARTLTLFAANEGSKACIETAWSALREIVRRQPSTTDIIQEEILARENGLSFYHDDFMSTAERGVAGTAEPQRRQLQVEGERGARVLTEIPRWYDQTKPISLNLYKELNERTEIFVGKRSQNGGFKGKGKVMLPPPIDMC